jgi:4-oxalomesaconate tautomerase
LALRPEGDVKIIDIGHPTGTFQVRLELGGSPENPTVERGGLIRTARALFDGTVFPRAKRSTGDVQQ